MASCLTAVSLPTSCSARSSSSIPSAASPKTTFLGRGVHVPRQSASGAFGTSEFRRSRHSGKTFAWIRFTDKLEQDKKKKEEEKKLAETKAAEAAKPVVVDSEKPADIWDSEAVGIIFRGVWYLFVFSAMGGVGALAVPVIRTIIKSFPGQ
eukprot:jgi/Mesvir1/23210/Mv22671-RA.1